VSDFLLRIGCGAQDAITSPLNVVLGSKFTPKAVS
jgi:hypothetical protein